MELSERPLKKQPERNCCKLKTIYNNAICYIFPCKSQDVNLTPAKCQFEPLSVECLYSVSDCQTLKHYCEMFFKLKKHI